MKEAIAWTKKLDEIRAVENILLHEVHTKSNEERIMVLLTQVAFEVYVHEIQKAQGTWKKSMRFEDRLDNIKEYIPDEYVQKDLKQMYDIRNEYAHKLTVDEQLIKSKLNGLEQWTEKTRNVEQRRKYVFAAGALMFKLQSGLQVALQRAENKSKAENS